MKRTFTACVLLAAALTGCMRGAPATNAQAEGKRKSEDTFTLSIQRVADLKQGTTQGLTVAIHRGRSFDHDVVLKFSDIPTGVTLRPVVPVIKHDDDEVRLTLRAAGDAALGAFAIQVRGRPTQGADFVTQIRSSVVKRDEPWLATAPALDGAQPSTFNHTPRSEP